MSAILYVLRTSGKLKCMEDELRKIAGWAMQRRVCISMLGLAVLLLVTGCTSLDSFGGSRRNAKVWAEERGFAEVAVRAGIFELAVFVRRPETPVDTLTIYIEGDGAAWPSPYHPPRDPTPLKPVSLALAAADPAPAVAYLGRPCQYLDPQSLANCPATYWIERRFAPEVIEASNIAITELKSLCGADRIRLVGYSGGGVIAALLATRRDDVESLITVGAPLALAKWVQWHRASPLTGSVDPIDANKSMSAGVHFVGEDDKTVPAAILEHYVRSKGGKVVIMHDFNHECCWSRDWPALLHSVIAQEMK